jgi:hypothetical protein
MLAPKFLDADWQLTHVQTEFTGAADRLIEGHSDPSRTLHIAPYEVDVLSWGNRRGWGKRGRREGTGLSAELRTLDRYLESVRRADSGDLDAARAG